MGQAARFSQESVDVHLNTYTTVRLGDAQVVSFDLCPTDYPPRSFRMPTEWQHIGSEIDTAFIFARTNFVNVHLGGE